MSKVYLETTGFVEIANKDKEQSDGIIKGWNLLSIEEVKVRKCLIRNCSLFILTPTYS